LVGTLRFAHPTHFAEPVIGLRVRADPLARNNGERHTSAFPRHILPELCVSIALNNQRAQGMPGAVAPASLACSKCAKNAHESSTGTTEHTPASPARWFTVYTWSPRSAGLLASVPPAFDPGVDASVGASGPHDFTRPQAMLSPARQAALSILTSTAPRLQRPWRPRYAPLRGDRMRADDHNFLQNGRSIFFAEDLDL